MKIYFAHLLLIIFVAIFLPACEPEKNNISNEAVSDSSIDKAETIMYEGKDNIWALYNYDEREGKRLFEHYCSVCHGIKGKGDGFNSYNLNPKPHSFADSNYILQLADSYLNQVITLGGESMNKSVLMPQYAHTLSEIQIDRIVSYIRTFLGDEY
jgi:mono/diheme cytochrome c family protein